MPLLTKMYRCYHLQVFTIGVVIIFSVVVVPQARAASRCPYKCKCGASSVACVDKELIEVPDFKRVVAEPTAVDLSNNDIEEITTLSFNFKQLAMVVSLKLHANTIFDVQAGAFTALPKLQHLDLSNNLIEDFQDALILNNKELKELNLAGNLFGTKTPALKSLSLEVLDLSYCKLSKFGKENVEGLPNLRLLYLQANSLIELDYGILGASLKFVDLAFNSWKCQCETVRLFDHLVQNNLTEVSSPVQCIQSFRRYEDVYDSYGPVKKDKWCDTKPARASVNASMPATLQNNSNETCAEYDKIWIGVAVLIGAVVASGVVILILVLRNQKKSSTHNVRSNNAVYSELSTRNTISFKRNPC